MTAPTVVAMILESTQRGRGHLRPAGVVVSMSDDKTEWEEWNIEVTFTFTYGNEGPFPVGMPDEERAEKVKEDFEREWGEEFYEANSSAQRHRLETNDPEKYER